MDAIGCVLGDRIAVTDADGEGRMPPAALSDPHFGALG